MKSPQHAISDAEFADTFKESANTLHEIVTKDHPKDLIPVLQVVCRSGFGAELQVHAFGLANFPATHEERAQTLNAIGHMVYTQSDKFGSPVAIIFVSEAWTLAKQLSPEAVKMFEKSGKRVSEHKNKKEIIIVTGRTIDGRRAMSMYDTVRVKGALERIDETLNSFEAKGKTKPTVDTILLDNFYRGVYEAARDAKDKKGEN